MRKTVGIIGLGLLGGSLAKGLTKLGTYRIIGYDHLPEVCKEALKDKVIEDIADGPGQVISQSDIVVFAMPPDINAQTLVKYKDLFRPGTLVTDVSSTKKHVIKAVEDCLPADVHFVSIHPMAGSEKGGYAMAKADLFQNCAWIILEDRQSPHWNEGNAKELEVMGQKLGGRIEWVPMAKHDHLLATVSHMPHVVAAMVTTVAGNDQYGDLRLRLAAGGFRDITRVAGGTPSMWREIISGNRKEVLWALDALEGQIEEIKQMLTKDPSGQALESYLTRARTIRKHFQEIIDNTANPK